MLKQCKVCGRVKSMQPTATTCSDCTASGFKYCKRCDTIKSVSEFTKGSSGYWHICKKCYAQQKKNERSTPEGRKAAQLACSKWYSTPHGMQHEKNRSHARRSLKTHNSYVTAEQWAGTLEYFYNSCAYCGESANLTQDHIVPLSKGGENTVSNVVPACKHCNYSKGPKDMLTWYVEQECFDIGRLMRIQKFTGTEV